MKGKKIIVSALAATMVAAPIAALTTVDAKVSAATSDENAYSVFGPKFAVVRSQYPTSGKVGENVTAFPKFESVSGTYRSLTVVDPYGNELKLGDGEYDLKAEGSDKLTFKPRVAGQYTYKFTSYSTKNVGGEDVQSSIATTYELVLTVTGDSGSLEIPENSYFVIPGEFKAGSALTLPVPETFVSDQEAAIDFDSTTATDASVDTESDKYGAVTTTINVNGEQKEVKLVVELVGKTTKDAKITFVKNPGTGNGADQKAHFVTAALAKDDYKLVYKLYYKNNLVAMTSSKTIKVNDTLSTSKLYASFAKTPAKSAEAGVKYNLVDLNVSLSENSTNYVDAFTQVTVKHVSTGEMMDVNYENMYFIPKYTGDYLVTYKALIPSLGLESEEIKYSIVDVSDTTQPKLYLTGDYEIDENGNTYIGSGESKEVLSNFDADENDKYGNFQDYLYDKIEDLSYNVKSYYVVDSTGKVTVKIPAAYVSDAFCKANNMTISRALYRKTNTSDSAKLKLVKSDLTTEESAYNKVAYFTFDKNSEYGIGSYVVKYTVKDGYNASVTYDYDIIIKDESIKKDSTKNKVNVPTVTFGYDTESAKKGDTLTFDAPTSTDPYDSNNVKTRVFYWVGGDADAITDAELKATYNEDAREFNLSAISTEDRKITELKNINKKNSKYQIETKTLTTGEYVYIAVVSQNSYNADEVFENRNYVVKKVKLIGNTADNNAPEDKTGYTGAAGFNTALAEKYKEKKGTATAETITDTGYVNEAEKKALYNQNDVVYLPDFKFEDADSAVDFEIKVSYMRLDKQVNVKVNRFETEVEKVGGNFVYTIKNAEFNASYAKLYTVTLVATDNNGNATMVSYGVRVNDTEAPVIDIVNRTKFSSGVEAGADFEVPAPTIYDDGEVVSDANWYWSYIDPNTNAETKMTKYNRTLKTAKLGLGTYTIKYYCFDAAGNPASIRMETLEVTASEKPEITLASIVDTSDRAWNNGAPNKIELPMATAKDKYFNDPIIVGKPKVTNSKGDEIKVDLNTAGDAYEFAPDVQGKYTIVYSAQGKYQNNTKTININVGDTEAPTLDWKDKESLKTTLEVGDTWTFKFDMIEAKDDNDNLADLINGVLNDGGTTLTKDKVKSLASKGYATVSMTKDGEEVDYTIADNGMKYTFDKTGEYTFTIKLKDTAGNSTNNTYKYTITVKDSDTKTNTNKDTSVVGTVLIVLSVVILAGVVAYFVITTKKVDKKAVEAKDKKDKKNNK